MGIRPIFRRVVGEDLSLFGFDMQARKPACIRRFEPWIEQSVELVSSTSYAGDRIKSLMLSTSIDAFKGSPGYYGPGLSWTFTMNALVANPRIECELQLPKGDAEDQVEAWLRSMSRELQGVGLEFFDRTRSIERLLDFEESDLCRERSEVHSEDYAKLRRAMLYKLLERSAESEKEIGHAEALCPSRFKEDLHEFIAFVRGFEVGEGRS